jgi:hypothetical protein
MKNFQSRAPTSKAEFGSNPTAKCNVRRVRIAARSADHLRRENAHRFRNAFRGLQTTLSARGADF